MITYGAITPRTSGDLSTPDAASQSSSSSANFLAAKGKKHQKHFPNNYKDVGRNIDICMHNSLNKAYTRFLDSFKKMFNLL